MLKYHFRVFNKDNETLILSSIVPADSIFDWIEKYKDLGVIKSYVLNESEDSYHGN